MISEAHKAALRTARLREIAEGKPLFGGAEGRAKARATISAQRKGKTYEEIYGVRAGAERITRKISNITALHTGNPDSLRDFTGLTYDEIYGDRADLERAKRREALLARGAKSRFHSTRYKLWRHLVLERDSDTCQSCGKVSKSNDAHHIVAWDESESMRFDIDNGMTLCRPCHNSIHPR